MPEVGMGEKRMKATSDGSKAHWTRNADQKRFRENTDNWRSNPANKKYDQESEFINA